MELLYLALGAGVLALLFAVVTSRRVLREDDGTAAMQRIAALIQDGAAAFLSREYTFLAGFVAVVAILIAWIAIDYRRQKARLRELEASGAVRRSGRGVADI